MDHRAKFKTQNNKSSRKKKNSRKISETYNRHIVHRLDTKAQFLKGKKCTSPKFIKIFAAASKEDEKTNYKKEIFTNHISIMELYLEHIKNYQNSGFKKKQNNLVRK